MTYPFRRCCYFLDKLSFIRASSGIVCQWVAHRLHHSEETPAGYPSRHVLRSGRLAGSTGCGTQGRRSARELAFPALTGATRSSRYRAGPVLPRCRRRRGSGDRPHQGHHAVHLYGHPADMTCATRACSAGTKTRSSGSTRNDRRTRRIAGRNWRSCPGGRSSAAEREIPSTRTSAASLYPVADGCPRLPPVHDQIQDDRDASPGARGRAWHRSGVPTVRRCGVPLRGHAHHQAGLCFGG